jgi:diguanylate cyclase (GGDEF)-like protein
MSRERPRLLVVDDREADNAVVRELVGMYNYEVLEVGDGASALRLLQEAQVDSIFVSLELPEGGFELSHRLRDTLNLNDLPVAFVSGAEFDQATLMEAQFYGGMFLISKPYEPVEVLTQLSSMLRIKFLQDELKQHLEELDRLASTDPLTGLFNRRLLFIRLEQELARMRRTGGDLCLAYLDIDHFKKINDTFGHLAGDMVLRQLAEIMNTLLRKSDVLARMGGEEFLIMLPDTGQEGGRLIADRLRLKVQNSTFEFEGVQIPVTISLGVLHINPAISDPPDELVRRADEALYFSKHSGRNRVSVYGVDCGPGIDIPLG